MGQKAAYHEGDHVRLHWTYFYKKTRSFLVENGGELEKWLTREVWVYFRKDAKVKGPLFQPKRVKGWNIEKKNHKIIFSLATRLHIDFGANADMRWRFLAYFHVTMSVYLSRVSFFEH